MDSYPFELIPIIQIFVVVVVLSNVASEYRCSDPESLDVDSSDADVSNLTGFFRTPPNHPSVIHFSHVPRRYHNVKRALVRGQPFRCSNSDDVASITTTPTCPTDIIINYDENRSPSDLVETLCGCSKCLNRTDIEFERHHIRSCAVITEYVMVYRRTGCVYGRFVYHRVWEPLRIGCNCSTRRWRFGEEPLILPKSVVKRQTSIKQQFNKMASYITPEITDNMVTFT